MLRSASRPLNFRDSCCLPTRPDFVLRIITNSDNVAEGYRKETGTFGQVDGRNLLYNVSSVLAKAHANEFLTQVFQCLSGQLAESKMQLADSERQHQETACCSEAGRSEHQRLEQRVHDLSQQINAFSIQHSSLQDTRPFVLMLIDADADGYMVHFHPHLLPSCWY